MVELLRVLAVVPARGGSKRLPRKNVLLLGGKSLIQWTIDAGLESGVCTDILVSTDDLEVAAVARNGGALVPWLRPLELATDTAATVSVLTHALHWYEADRGVVDAVLLLQPTSPFRSAKSIAAAIELYAQQPVDEAQPVVSVSPPSSHPAWTFILNPSGEGMTPVMGWEPLQRRSQDLPPAYSLNGAIYVIPPNDIRHGLPLIRPGVLPFIMNDSAESLDIDTQDDWEAAERWYHRSVA